MLTKISIANFVHIDRVQMKFGPGFTAITGESGAGKSVLLKAFSFVLGGRADRRYIREQEDACCVVVEMRIGGDHPCGDEVRAIAGDLDGGLLRIERRLSRSGRSLSTLNGRRCSLAALRQLAPLICELHTQGATHDLFSENAQLTALDRALGLSQQVEKVAEQFHILQAARKKWLTAKEADESREIKLVEASEIIELLQPLEIQENEEEQLLNQRTDVRNATRREEILAELLGLADDAEVGRVLSRAAFLLSEMSSLTERSIDLVSRERVGTAMGHVDLALVELSGLRDEVQALLKTEQDKSVSLEEIDDRLFALRSAARRLSVPVERLPSVLMEAVSIMDQCNDSRELLDQLHTSHTEAAQQYHKYADELSKERSRGRTVWLRRLSEILKRLRMNGFQFDVELTRADDQVGPKGKDRVALLSRSSGSGEFLPLNTVSSGGERARLALAIKASLPQVASGACLVFDEVDVGLGGSTAAAMGAELSRLGGRGQVIAITHSAQVAGWADQHFKVDKSLEGEALSRVTHLSVEDRLEEFARMIAGDDLSPEALGLARSLLRSKSDRGDVDVQDMAAPRDWQVTKKRGFRSADAKSSNTPSQRRTASAKSSA